MTTTKTMKKNTAAALLAHGDCRTCLAASKREWRGEITNRRAESCAEGQSLIDAYLAAVRA